MSAPSACGGGGGGSAGGSDSAAGGDSPDSTPNTLFLPIFPFWFNLLINLPGTNWFIGFCGQRNDFITRLYLLWIEKTPSGDFNGEQPDVGEEIYLVNPSTFQWGLSDDLSKKPKKGPGIHYHYRNFYQGLPIMVVPILSMMNHFILLTDRYIYFFRINPQNKLDVIHTIEASSEAERRLYKSCAISANGQIMVVHHNSGFSVFSINMKFGQFQVDLMQYFDLPPQNRNVPGSPYLGDLHQVKMTGSGVAIWYESGCLENDLKKSINVLFPNDPQIFRFFIEMIPGLGFGHLTKFFQICEITPTKIGMIVGGDDCFRLLILNLDLGNIRIGVGERIVPGFTVQQICPCSVNSTHFFVAGQRKEVDEKCRLFNQCKLTPMILEFEILEKALVKIGEHSFNERGVSECSYLTSSNGMVTASFRGEDYRARLSVIGETTKVESSVQPPPSQSTLNGVPIGLTPSSVFALLQDMTIVSSNLQNGLTVFEPDCNPVVSTDKQDAHKSPITRIFPLEVDRKLYVLSFSSSDGSIKIWSIQKNSGETVHLRIFATVSTAELIPKKGVKFLALYGQTLLILTNQQEFLRFHVEISGIIAEIRPILGSVVQMGSGQICQKIVDFNPTHALINVVTYGVCGCSLVLVSFSKDAAEMFKTLGTREAGKSPAALILTGFAVSAVVGTTVCSTALAAGGASFSFTPKDFDKSKKLCDATILAIVPCEDGCFICITANGFLIQFVYDAQQKPVFKKRIAVLDCALTPKCQLQVSGDTVMVCQPRDDGSIELQTFPF